MAHYEDATSKLVPDDLRVAVVLRHAPDNIGRHLRIQASHDMSYRELREKLREYYVATRPWALKTALSTSPTPWSATPSSGAVPMDVDVLTSMVVSAIKGKVFKGKLDKGKGKFGKGKDKQGKG